MRRPFELPGSSNGLAVLLAVVALLAEAREANAAELTWKGYTWTLTEGGMAGVANGSPANVSVDADGYLHLKIQKNGNTWTAAELFSTTKLGFGTYQWQVDGPIDTLDKNVVLGFFPYGPAAGIGADGTNEIDIEYSRWGQADGTNGDWTDYPASGSTVGELSYTFSLSGGTLSTSRFIWKQSSIEDFLLAGLQPLTSSAQLLQTWKYSPPNPTTNIPQQALPLGINLWCFDIPSDGQDVEMVIRDFQFLAEGSDPGSGAGGEANGGAGGETGAQGGRAEGGRAEGGRTAPGGNSALGGNSANGGMTSQGGASAQAGASNGGRASAGRPSAGAGVTSTGGAPSSGAAGSSAGGRAVGGARQATANPAGRQASGCSVRAPTGAPRDGGLACMLALLAFVGLARQRRG